MYFDSQLLQCLQSYLYSYVLLPISALHASKNRLTPVALVGKTSIALQEVLSEHPIARSQADQVGTASKPTSMMNNNLQFAMDILTC